MHASTQFGRAALLTIFGFLTISPTVSQGGEPPAVVRVMAYNVENLFDTTHDDGKLDWTYLPRAEKHASKEAMAYCYSQQIPTYREECFELDWTPALLARKIDQISRVIRASHPRGAPDIIVVEEVENINVLRMLRDRGLADQGYREVVLLEGPDERGIDVGMLSRYPLARAPKLHNLNIVDKGKRLLTRGILEATFQVGNKQITVLGNHWPSQSNSPETRLVAARELNRIASQIPGAVVAMGDFNTTDKDNPNGLKEFVMNARLPTWFYDSDHEARRQGRNPGPGTYFYQGKWDSLDHLFVLESATCNINMQQTAGCSAPDWSSFGIVAPAFALHDIVAKKNGQNVTYRNVPWRFDASTGEGYADHLPLVMNISLY